MSGSYNLRNPGVKRLMREAAELREPTELFWAQPLEDNLFEWHFTVRGPPSTEFDGGIYHGRIILPADYPMKPPSIMILTPNGRFETNKKICLSISGHHPESWQPSWSIRTALLAIIGFMPTHGAGAIGSLDYTADERKALAQRSMDWKCPTCNEAMRDILPPLTEASDEASAEARNLAAQISFKDEKEQTKAKENSESNTETTSDNSRPVNHSTEAENVADNSGVRQRIFESNTIVRDTATVSTSSTYPANVHGQFLPHREEESGLSVGLIVIVVISAMIAALLFRRFYMINEWRFYSSRNQ